jgi:site-specific DNA-methyltransferase (adenine-specific)
MSHYLKIVLDCIFGEKNFRNEIIWGYHTGGVSKKYFPRKHDVLFVYGKDANKAKHNPLKETIKYDKPFFTTTEPDSSGKYPVDVYVRDVWDADIKPVINVSDERTGYPTQKPLALLERIIKVSSDEGDVVLDPFCGCATTCVAAEKLGRIWIGIDVSQKAYELVKKRLQKEVPADLFRGEPNFTSKAPTRDKDIDKLQKYVYIVSNPAYDGLYKVGVAANAESRLNQYQTADPNRAYKLEYKFLTPHYAELERYVHAKFDSRLEWVKASTGDIIEAIENFKPNSDDF